ncbi:MAG: hypothetical protein MUC94_08005 [bacterium]|nr:hypothetical protein [bacterium]
MKIKNRKFTRIICEAAISVIISQSAEACSFKVFNSIRLDFHVMQSSYNR